MTYDMQNASPTGRSDTREKVLRLLRHSGADLTVTQIATRLKLHPNTVRFHLDTLTARGLARRVPSAPDGPGRPALKVRATAVMDPDGPRHYQALAEVLAIALSDAPGSAKLARRAGRAWADQILAEQRPSPAAAPEAVLMEALDAASFAPDRTGDAEIGLHNCPFLELVDSAEQIVCSVHLGLMRRTLAALGSDRDVLRLDPFVRPGLCVAHLTERRPTI